jgi:purine-binding chemotaxis protein CheW
MSNITDASLKMISLLVFTLDEQRFALQSTCIKRIIRLVEITPLPNPEKNVLGVINLQGEMIPVIDIRAIFNLMPDKTPKIEDVMVIIEDDEAQHYCFVVDEVNFMEAETSHLASADVRMNNKLNFLDKILKDPEGPINILNIGNIIGQTSIDASFASNTLSDRTG